MICMIFFPSLGEPFAMASSPLSVCSSLSSADSERLQRLERRVMGSAQKQLEKELMEELRYRDYEEKLRVRAINIFPFSPSSSSFFVTWKSGFVACAEWFWSG